MLAHPIDIAVGNRIRTLRMRAGLSQEELGLKIGISFQQLQKNERGANRLSASRLVQIAEALQVPIEEIFEGITSAKEAAQHKPPNVEGLKLAREWEAIENDDLRASVRQMIRTILRAQTTED